MQEITFITGNQAKAEQLALYLKRPLTHLKLDLVEIQSLDLEEVVRDKAERAYKTVMKPVLVEDTSLIFNALGRLPGPLIKWFLSELDNKGLALLLDGKDRAGIAQVMFGFHNGTACYTFSGFMKGRITNEPRGKLGFGWDPIFIPEGHTKTWGEMSPEEQRETSIRRIALAKLEAFLGSSGTD